jgi:hypothetical protein
MEPESELPHLQELAILSQIDPVHASIQLLYNPL